MREAPVGDRGFSDGVRNAQQIETSSAFVYGCGWGDYFIKVADLVLELDCNVLERGRVLAGVVGTKQQSAPGWQHRTQVGAGAAPITSIRGRQRRRGQYRSHVHALLIG
jgi:hypothetical protein